MLTIAGIQNTALFVPRDLASANAGARCACAADENERDCTKRYAGAMFGVLAGAREQWVLARGALACCMKINIETRGRSVRVKIDDVMNVPIQD